MISESMRRILQLGDKDAEQENSIHEKTGSGIIKPILKNMNKLTSVYGQQLTVVKIEKQGS